jgi:hypothetical protein
VRRPAPDEHFVMGKRNPSVRQFKGAAAFHWDSKPSDERPTEFGASTSYSSLHGHSELPGDSRLDRPQSDRQARATGVSLWFVLIIVTAVAILGLIALSRVLHPH